ncbi:hypothetical protein BDP27DRAFT_1443427 [Rhodocollybia butyracea]|uniref:Nephrocystin 3-like N-terminal domain-containing protein n=1 Tax=Rhodocollybia butyracea TaxID=206335 RepID=A0A9P5Q6R4_9AGAR|nr:hypothetical protein BDP27DRAFT_1443427 [Rhodocollybia butyracea]
MLPSFVPFNPYTARKILRSADRVGASTIKALERPIALYPPTSMMPGYMHLAKTVASFFRRSSSPRMMPKPAATVQGVVGSSRVPDSIAEHAQSSPPSAERHTTQRIVAVAKFALTLLDSVADKVPFAGMTTIVGGLLALFEQYEKFDENDKDIADLRENLEVLRKFVERFKDKLDLPENIAELLTNVDTEDIKAELINLNKGTKPWKFLGIGDHYVQMELLYATGEGVQDISRYLSRILQPEIDASRFKRLNDTLLKAPEARDCYYCKASCQGGTRVKVLRCILDWVIGESELEPPIFFLHGNQGSGKTAVAVSILKNIVEDSDRDIRFAGFFCSSLQENTSNPKHIFPTLAAQLAYRNDVYSFLEYAINHQVSYNSVVEQFKHFIHGPLHQLDETEKVLLVIDAIDECRDIEEAIKVVEVLLEKAHKVSSLKVLICCRSDSEIFVKIRERFNDRKVCRSFSLDQDVDPEELGRDLRSVLFTQLSQQRFHRKTVISLMEIFEDAGCSSFFLMLAACSGIQLRPDDLTGEFRRLLSCGMDGFYQSFIDSALKKINLGDRPGIGRDTNRYRAALVIVAFGRNSLGLEGLSVLLEVPVGQLRIFFEGFPINILDIVEDDMVSITHSSFQEYVKSGQAAKTDNNSGPSSQDCMHLYITRHLFLHMLKAPLRRNMFEDNTELKRSPNRTLQYACRYWPKHLKSVGMAARGEDWVELTSLLLEFFRAHLLHWLEALVEITDVRFLHSTLQIILSWVKKHCTSDSEAHQSLRSIVSDVYSSFQLSKAALQLSSAQVYRTFLLPLTHPGRRLAHMHHSIENSVTVDEVSCHRRQLISLANGHVENESRVIKLSQDATRCALVRSGRIEIASSNKDIYETFLEDKSGLCSYVDALFVGKDQVLVTQTLKSGLTEVGVWNIESKKAGELLLEQEHVSPPVLALSSDGSVAAVSSAFKVEVWNIGSWATSILSFPIRRGHPRERLLALSPHHILVNLHLRKLTGRSGTSVLEFRDKPLCATFSPEGDTLAIGGKTGIALYKRLLSQGDMSKISPSIVLDISHPITSLVLSPKARYLAAGGVSFLWVWKTSKSTVDSPSMTLENDKSQIISSVVFSGNGRYLHCAHTSLDSKTVLFDMRDMKFPSSSQMPVTALAISSNGRIATGSNNGSVSIWNSRMTRVLQNWQRESHRSAVVCVAFSQDGKLIASVSNERIYIRATHPADLDSDFASPILTCDRGSRFLSPCTFSGNSSLFLCISKDGDLRAHAQIWETGTWTSVGRIESSANIDFGRTMSIAFSQEGDLLAVSGQGRGQDRAVVLYSISSSYSVSIKSSRLDLQDIPRSLAFTLDSRYIRSTAGAFDVEMDLRSEDDSHLEPELRLSDVFIKDGWVMDLDGKERCHLPSEDICDWVSRGSTVVYRTQTLGNVGLISVQPFSS